MTKHRRTIETPEGRGLLRLASHGPIAVSYWLVVMQTIDDQADTGALVGLFDVRGKVEVRLAEGAADIDLTGKTFDIETSDGRFVKAVAKRRDPASGQWEIVSTGRSGLAPR